MVIFNNFWLGLSAFICEYMKLFVKIKSLRKCKILLKIQRQLVIIDY